MSIVNIIIGALALFLFVKWLKSYKSIYFWGFIPIITISTIIPIISGLDGCLAGLYTDYGSSFVRFISILYVLCIITNIIILVILVINKKNKKLKILSLIYIVISLSIMHLSTFFDSGIFFEVDIEYILTEEGGSWGGYFLEIFYNNWHYTLTIIIFIIAYSICSKKKKIK